MPARVLGNRDGVYSDSSSKISRYRPEIDGLRAFAVAAVIINHFNKDILPGGYLGVDISFVISGYVITSSLFGRPSKDFKDFISGFYTRRIRRLVPALSVFILIASIAISLFNPKPEAQLEIGKSALFGFSNIALYNHSIDYFAQSTELNVFTHSWSLGVEEQFYILFPFLIWFSGFGRQTKNSARNLLLAVGSLTIASLIGFLYLYPTNQPAAYFLMPPRFWEMAAGCLIFIGFQKRVSIEQFLERVPPLLVMILIVGVMYLPMSMASASTIAMVALSSILIASLKKETAAFNIFTHPRVVYIGLISYSLYLWHWGVLSISRWTIGIHWWSIPFQVALIIGLAIASYRWIETPFRNSKLLDKQWKTLVIGGGLIITCFGFLTALSKPLQGKLFIGDSHAKEKALTMDGKSLRRKCYTYKKSVDAVFKDCTFRNGDSINTIWLVGDSHAESILFAVDSLAKEMRMNLFAHFYSRTAFPSTPYKLVNNKKILTASKKFKEVEERMVSKFMVGDVLIIGIRYPYHFGSDWYEYKSDQFLFPGSDGKYSKKKDKSEYFMRWLINMEKFSAAAKVKGVSIILITPTPEFPEAVQKHCKGQNDQWFNHLSKTTCSMPRSFFTGDSGIYLDIRDKLQELASKRQNIFLIDGINLMCKKDECFFADNEMPLFKDDDHISNYGAKSLVLPALRSLIDNKAGRSSTTRHRSSVVKTIRTGVHVRRSFD